MASSVVDDPVSRPKGMHRKAFLHLERRYIAAQQQMNALASAHFGLPLEVRTSPFREQQNSPVIRTRVRCGKFLDKFTRSKRLNNLLNPFRSGPRDILFPAKQCGPPTPRPAGAVDRALHRVA